MRLKVRKTVGPALLAVLATAIVSVALYLAVHFEGRYVVFAAVICGAIFAAAAHTGTRLLERASVHRVVLLVAFLLLVGEVQWAVRASKNAPAGDRPAAARFDTAEYNVGQALVSRFGPHPQVACLGPTACSEDALWAWYGDATISGVLLLPHRVESATTSEVCDALTQNQPATLEALRTHRMRAVVGYFGPGTACSPQWQPIPDAPGYFLLPL